MNRNDAYKFAAPLLEQEAAGQLSAFLQAEREAILITWNARIDALPAARRLRWLAATCDHVPLLLSQITEQAEAHRFGRAPVALTAGEVHALQRMELGYELNEIVLELALLRDCVLLHNIAWGGLPPQAVHYLSRSLDENLGLAIACFTQARERRLLILESLSQVRVVPREDGSPLDEIIRLARPAFVTADIVAILPRDKHILRVGAAYGLDIAAQDACAAQGKQSFLGGVAAARAGQFVRDASCDIEVFSDSIARPPWRATYAAPLLEADQLVGVAFMASREAFDFTEEERLLFRAAAGRAATLLVHQKLLEDERTARRSAELALSERLVVERALEERVVLEQQLVGIVSHDLRNPLGAISLTANQILQTEGLSGRLRNGLKRIVRAAERSIGLIHDLLDFTRVRFGSRMCLALTDIDLATLTEHIVDELRQAHPARRIEVVGPSTVRGAWDEGRLSQVLTNLVANALFYSAADSVVTVRLTTRDNIALLEVHNYGTPIAPDLLPHLFTPLRRGSLKSRQGLGLGLFIAHTIVRAHGGTLGVKSHDDGTLFTARLPCTQGATTDQDALGLGHTVPI